MKFTSAHLKTLNGLYVAQLRKTLDMERSVAKALPEMIEQATNQELASAFRSHLLEAEDHVDRVENLLKIHEAEANSETCKVIHALISECNDGVKDADDEAIRDTTLIAAAQQVEHHEIAVYGTLRAWAELLGHSEDMAMLENTLREEKAADHKLTSVASTATAAAAA